MQYIYLIVMINGFHIKSLNMWKTLSDYIVKACNGQYLHRLQRWQTFVWCLRLAVGEKIREDLLYRQVWAIEDEGHYNEISSNVFIYIYIYIYIYAFSRRFYPKRLTLHSSYSFYILSALAFPGNRTHDLGVANAMLYQLSYRKAVIWNLSAHQSWCGAQ